jgi:hypothetical protein
MYGILDECVLVSLNRGITIRIGIRIGSNNFKQVYMKTPVQELIDKLNNVKPDQFCSIETIKGWAESMLEKEKEVMNRVWLDGRNSRINGQDPLEQIKNL